MGSSATAQGIVKKGTNVFITQEDVALLMNCKKSKAYAIIRSVNEYAKKKGQLKFPVGKANKYLFAEIYGIPIEDVNRIISGGGRRRHMERRTAMRYAEIHKGALEDWHEGEIQKVWTDGDGNMCIAYESGRWWHYRETGDGGIEWW